MANAKEEFIKVVGSSIIKCVEIHYYKHLFKEHEKDPQKDIFLKVGHTEEEFTKFLDELDFVYDSGYGTRELKGTIWFEDGTWCTRAEYDGSEWWEYHVCPAVPPQLYPKKEERSHVSYREFPDEDWY